MSLLFFNDVMKILGKKVRYDAVVNYAGNSFAKDAWKMIEESNPLVKENRNKGFLNMISGLNINANETQKKKESEKVLTGLDWAEGLMT